MIYDEALCKGVKDFLNVSKSVWILWRCEHIKIKQWETDTWNFNVNIYLES